jgi:hypothetical protein
LFDDAEIEALPEPVALYPAQKPVLPALPTTHAQHLRNPALLGFPPTLPVELALGDHNAQTICDAYGITRTEFESLCENPVFQKAFADASELLQKEGMSFRIKARMQAEELLKASWNLIENPGTSASVKADLIKATWRVAGFEPKATDGPAITPIQINVNL